MSRRWLCVRNVIKRKDPVAGFHRLHCIFYVIKSKGSYRWAQVIRIDNQPTDNQAINPSGDCHLEVCENDFLVPIPFPLSSNHSHSHFHPFPFQHCIPIPSFPITSIPIPTHSHFHFRHWLHIDYLKADKYVYYVVNSKQNMKLVTAEALLIKFTTHQSSSL